MCGRNRRPIFPWDVAYADVQVPGFGETFGLQGRRHLMATKQVPADNERQWRESCQEK
jgi:hypothetical protein